MENFTWKCSRHEQPTCRYNAVNFHGRQPIAHPSGRVIDCLLWVQPLIDILPHVLQWCVQCDVNYSAKFIDSSGPHMLKPCAKNCDTSRITWIVTPLPIMVVLMTAASCLNKDLHINCYKKETRIKFDNCSLPMPLYQSMLKSCNFDE